MGQGHFTRHDNMKFKVITLQVFILVLIRSHLALVISKTCDCEHLSQLYKESDRIRVTKTSLLD